MGWGGARPNSGPKKRNPQAPRAKAEPTKFVPLQDAKARSVFDDPRALQGIAAIIETSERTKRRRFPDVNPFKIDHDRMHPPGAIPPKGSKLRMAMDDSINWAANSFSGAAQLGAFNEGLEFLGYAYLAQLAQRPEYRSIVDTIATEMTRKWIKFQGTGDADKTEKIKELNDYLDSLHVRDVFGESAALEGYFGRTHLYIDLFGDDRMLDGDPKWEAELTTPIGNGSDAISAGKLGKGCLKRLQTVEPTWTYPTTYNAQNPLRSDWYKPQQWYVMGKQLHRSRLLTFVGRPLPDQLKPAYSFGGLALTQMAKPYVDIWLTTRQSVADIIHAFSVMVLMTDLQAMLQPGGQGNILARAALFNALRDNQGLFIVNKATEDFKNVSAPLSGLDHLQAQAQEHLMSVVHIPAVIFTGIQPTGLNSSSEGEIRVFYDMIGAYQNKLFRPNLSTVIDIAMISLWGERDPEITYEFVPLWELSEKEKSEKRKIEAETDMIYADGVVSPEEIRTKLVNDPESPYHGLDPDDVPDLEEEEDETGFVPGKGTAGEKDSGEERDGASDAILPFAGDAEFNEADHPRNHGKFSSGAGGGSSSGELPSGMSIKSGPSKEFNNPKFNSDPRAHTVLLHGGGKGDPEFGSQYRMEVVDNGKGNWVVGHVENLAQEHKGMAPVIYREAAKYVEDKGGRLLAGFNTNAWSRAALKRMAETGLATKVEDPGGHGREIYQIHSTPKEAR